MASGRPAFFWTAASRSAYGSTSTNRARRPAARPDQRSKVPASASMATRAFDGHALVVAALLAHVQVGDEVLAVQLRLARRST
jgi:hypothetical protein